MHEEATDKLENLKQLGLANLDRVYWNLPKSVCCCGSTFCRGRGH